MSKVQRPGDYEWVLWTTHRDGSTQILLRIFAPDIHEARAHWGPQRENRAISSMLSYRNMGTLPKPPAPDDDYSRTVTIDPSLKVRPGQIHAPNRAKQVTMRALFAATRSDRATGGKPRETKKRRSA